MIDFFCNPEQIDQQIAQRQRNNLACFETYYPKIVQAIVEHGDLLSKLIIDPDKKQIDYRIQGKSIYQSDAILWAEKEVDSFLKEFKPGSKLTGLTPSFSEDFFFPRYFNQTMVSLLKQSSLSPLPQDKSYYKVPNFYPHLVFLGCGLGIQIGLMVAQYTIHRLTVVEPDIELFIRSLSIIDWYQIIENREAEGLPSIEFQLGNVKHWHQIEHRLWNHLVSFCPTYPLTTLYFVHRGEPEFYKICSNIDTRIYSYICSWGQYDDEINQWNQALHNINNQSPLMRTPSDQLKQQPIAIVGSGSSLDHRIDQLRSLQKTHLIISCGSSITALHAYGIRPDIHVELESDYDITVNYLKAVDDPNYLDDVFFIGVLHLNPFVFRFFKHHAALLKQQASVSQTLLGDEIKITDCGPTCVNLALSWSLLYGAKEVVLFGTDFGFQNIAEHHARGSIYYQEEAHPSFKASVNYAEQQLFEIEGVDSLKSAEQTVFTSPLYFSAKERLENAIQVYRNRCWTGSDSGSESHGSFMVYNCSDGAKIAGSTWVDGKKDLHLHLERSCKHKLNIEQLKSLITESPGSTSISSCREQGLKELHIATDLLRNVFLEKEVDKIDALMFLDKICMDIRETLRTIESRYPAAYLLIKGSVYHYLHTGYSHALAINSLQDSDSVCGWVLSWRKSFLEFLIGVNRHFKETLFKDYDLDDESIRKALSTPLSIDSTCR